ncbi:helix-hairpin-helix domain-containing protein [Pirellulales bacterium]|nr:helix-hairpin-helix domain-containing protein [Pirellulales bacterium]
MAISPSKPWLRANDQRSLAVLAATGLLCLAGYWIYHAVWGTGLTAIDESPPLSVEFRVDLNRADWPELVQLPGIGPTIAQRVVEDRAARGRFKTVEELQRVRGIGPRTIERIKPYAVVDAR